MSVDFALTWCSLLTCICNGKFSCLLTLIADTYSRAPLKKSGCCILAVSETFLIISAFGQWRNVSPVFVFIVCIQQICGTNWKMFPDLMNSIKNNNSTNSNYAEHILEMNHVHGTIENTTNTLTKFHISNLSKQNQHFIKRWHHHQTPDF